MHLNDFIILSYPNMNEELKTKQY